MRHAYSCVSENTLSRVLPRIVEFRGISRGIEIRSQIPRFDFGATDLEVTILNTRLLLTSSSRSIAGATPDEQRESRVYPSSPHFPRVLALRPLASIAMIALAERAVDRRPTFARCIRAPSTLDLPLCWLTRLGRLPTRSSYERRGPPSSLSSSSSSPPSSLPLPLSLYVDALLQWRLINPLTQCCSFLLRPTKYLRDWQE